MSLELSRKSAFLVPHDAATFRYDDNGNELRRWADTIKRTTGSKTE